MSWEKLSPAARELGGVLRTLALALISAELMQACLPDWEDKVFEGILNREWVKNSLLLSLGNGRFILHTLIYEFVGAKLTTNLASDAERIRTQVAQGATLFAKRIPSIVTLPALAELQDALPHIAIVANRWTGLLSKSDMTWPLEGLARVAKGQSRWSEATNWYQQTLKISEAQLGENHPETGTRLNNLANLYRSTGRYSKAEPLYERALILFVHQLGQDHLNAQTVLNNFVSFIQTAIAENTIPQLSNSALTQSIIKSILQSEDEE